MTSQEWDNIVDGVFAAHGKASPSDRIRAKWFEHVYDVPTKPAAEIATQLERAVKLDANFGAQFLSAWRSWREANPEKCAREPQRSYGCRNCHSGWVWWCKYDRSGFVVTGASPCACMSPRGVTPEQLEGRNCTVGSPLDVYAIAQENNRAKTGWGQSKWSRYEMSVEELAARYRNVRLGGEERALLAAEA